MRSTVLQIAALMVLASSAFGQAQLVDQSVEDVDPLATSLRFLQPQLRQDTDFTLLYSDPRYPGWYYRRDGAITAFVPQGDYYATRDGIVTAIPAGTIFFIGDPSPEMLPDHPSHSPFAEGASKRPAIGLQTVQRATSVARATIATKGVDRVPVGLPIMPMHADENAPGNSATVVDADGEHRIPRIPTPALMREDGLYRSLRLRDIAQRAAGAG